MADKLLKNKYGNYVLGARYSGTIAFGDTAAPFSAKDNIRLFGELKQVYADGALAGCFENEKKRLYYVVNPSVTETRVIELLFRKEVEYEIVDGAGHYTVFLKIMMPMAMPSLSAIMILNILGIWNEYFTFYMYAPSKVTLALGLNGLVEANKYGKVSYPELFAVMLFSVVPAVLLYTFAQKLIVNNVNIGGLKG